MKEIKLSELQVKNLVENLSIMEQLKSEFKSYEKSNMKIIEMIFDFHNVDSEGCKYELDIKNQLIKLIKIEEKPEIKG